MLLLPSSSFSYLCIAFVSRQTNKQPDSKELTVQTSETGEVPHVSAALKAQQPTSLVPDISPVR